MSCPGARRVEGLGMSEILIAPRAPCQNLFAERVIGSSRRECLDHVIVFNEWHLRRLLCGYLAYYNATRPHQSLHKGPPKEAAPDGGGADEAHADRPTRATASMMGNVHVVIEISFVTAYRGGVEPLTSVLKSD
jgi:hypothetical protein